MPYIPEDERTSDLIEVSDQIYKLCLEFLNEHEGKYLNFTIFRGFKKAWDENKHYEEGRKLQSVLNDIAAEFQNRRNEYENTARVKNGDV